MAELLWKRLKTSKIRDLLEDSPVINTKNTDELNFSKWFTYQDQNLSNVHNSAQDVEELCHERMEKFLWKRISTKKVSNEEISSYIKWLDSKQKRIFSSLYDDGCSFNDAVAYMDAYNENPDLFKNPTAPWVWKFEEKPSTWQSILQAPIDIVTWLPRLFNEWKNAILAWWLKMAWEDADYVDKYFEEDSQAMKDDITLDRADRDSLAYEWTDLVTDLALTELITSALAWPIWAVWWLALRSKKIADFVSKYPKFMKYLWAFWKWAEDMAVMDTLEWELPNWWNEGVWWLVNMWLEAFGGKSVWWLKWIMNKSDAKNVLKALADDWLEKVDMSLSQLGEFFNKIGAKWTRSQILSRLKERQNKVIQLKDDLLSVSDELFKNKDASTILNQLFEWYSKHPWNEKLLEEIAWLISKTDEYTLKQLERIRTLWQDSPLNPFLKNTIKEVKDAWGTPWNLNLYNSIRKSIFDWAEKLWIWDINALNKEIQITKAAAKWVEDKILWDQLRKELATYTSLWTIWWISSLIAWRDWKEWVLWWLSIKLLFNLATKPTVRSYVSDAIYKMKGWVKKELTDFIWKWWELSEDAVNKLVNILDNAKWDAKNEILKFIEKLWAWSARVEIEAIPWQVYEWVSNLLWWKK